MLHKFIVALLATLILCFVLIIPNSLEPQTNANTYYWSSSDLFTLFLIYVAPCMFLLGIPFSLLIDRIARRRNFSSALGRYLFHFLLYALAAVPAVFVFVLVLAWDDPAEMLEGFIGFITLGAIGSLLFYHVSLLTLAIAKLFKKRPNAS